MGTINAGLNAVFDGLFAVLGWMPPILSLFVISGLVGLVMIMVFGKISNQAGIKKAKDRIQCNLFVIRLYKDELGLTFKAMSKLLIFLLPYLAHQIVPLVVMLGPILLVASQLNARYGYAAIEPGQSAIVSVKLTQESPPEALDIVLTTDEGVEVETKPVRIPSAREVDFRIRIDQEGEHTLRFDVNGETVEKKVNGRSGLHRVSHVRSSTFLDLLLYCGEPALPKDSVIQSISVETPIAEVSLFGLEIHWIIWFLVFSLIVAFLLKGMFGVVI